MPQKKKTNVLAFEVGGRVTLTQKAVFARHLAVMLQSGLTLTEALNIASQSARGRLRRVILGVLESVQSGETLSDSFARYPKIFTGPFVSAVYAGEASGTLEKNLSNVAEQLEKERDLIGKIKGAMLYPIVVLIASFGMGLAMAFLVLPKIIPLFEGLNVNLPLTTRLLIKFSHFIDKNGLEFFVGLVVAIFLLIWLARRRFTQPITHWLILHFPIVNKISHNVNLTNFSRTLGALLKSGLNIDEAMEITASTCRNYYYRRVLKNACPQVEKDANYPKFFASRPIFFRPWPWI